MHRTSSMSLATRRVPLPRHRSMPRGVDCGTARSTAYLNLYAQRRVLASSRNNVIQCSCGIDIKFYSYKLKAHFGFPAVQAGTRPEDHEEVCARTEVPPSGNDYSPDSGRDLPVSSRGSCRVLKTSVVLRCWRRVAVVVGHVSVLTDPPQLAHFAALPIEDRTCLGRFDTFFGLFCESAM